MRGVYITTDGDTLWLTCYPDVSDEETAHNIQPIEPGDGWGDLVKAVDEHECPEAL